MAMLNISGNVSGTILKAAAPNTFHQDKLTNALQASTCQLQHPTKPAFSSAVFHRLSGLH